MSVSPVDLFLERLSIDQVHSMFLTLQMPCVNEEVAAEVRVVHITLAI